jgi:uncharacterized protein
MLHQHDEKKPRSRSLTDMTPEALRDLLERDPHRAASTVQTLAGQGVSAAQLLFGRMLLEGTGCVKSPAAAFAWFRRAATDDHAEAINMLGRCLENGWGTAVDAQRAFGCYARAAQLGDDWAQYNLGHMYLDGNGVTRDPVLAMHWYALASAQGHARAMNLLARCYEEGWGVPKDSAHAADWYRKSAEAGYFRGQYNWATVLMAIGRADEATAWLSRAQQGATPSVRRIIADYMALTDNTSIPAPVLPPDHHGAAMATKRMS